MSALPPSASAQSRYKRPFEILLVEDNPGDVRLMIEALKIRPAPHRLSLATNGVEAMAILHRTGVYANAPRPDLVLLDLNMPGKDGRQVLGEIKSDEQLRQIPVIVLSTSRAEQDVRESYDLRANGYVSKPADLDDFMRVVAVIQDFWLATATLPTR